MESQIDSNHQGNPYTKNPNYGGGQFEEAAAVNQSIVEEEKKNMEETREEQNPYHIKQDNFFYKIKEWNAQKLQYIIEIPKLKKKYKIQFSVDSEFGFVGLPAEWERFVREMNVPNKEIAKNPFEFLMAVNFCATNNFTKMLNKSTLYERMGKICDQIRRKNPYDEFKIVEQLGKGGFGQVYLVQHYKSKKYFAMKEIAPTDDADLEDTLTEIALQNIASKGHKNIIGINKSYEQNEKGVDKFYLIMEWMDAGDLSTMLKTIPGQFSEQVIVYILK
mmetsp:Transcript_18942/g.32362  ORF Transcript_18942/g.32362 Transcript_18942/m.32362 type:complete len:276 (+) Transcript_18942:15-842(+)